MADRWQGVKAAAATALYGSDTDISTFLAETLPKQTVQDNRVAIISSLDRAGKGLRREAVAALESGDEAIAAFLTNGFRPAMREDFKVATNIVASTGGRGVNREASAALDAGTEAALVTFLTDKAVRRAAGGHPGTGQHHADDRWSGGAEVRGPRAERYRGRHRVVRRNRSAHRPSP